MDLSRVITGNLVTEKAERLKTERTYSLIVSSAATKIDVKNALKRFYDIEVTSIRVMRAPGKQRSLGAGKSITKRQAKKKVLVTLAPKSKALDLAQFKTT